MTDVRNWVVTLAEGDDAAAVASSLETAGFRIDQRLAEIGVITGRSTAEVAERARALPGIVDVAPEDVVDIGPPDAPTTW
ncbi:hypothetical protein [Sphingomonas mollis]|uniref:Ketohydroxyglutarate aldolase n=1 Tax=Sphingomonas mollis TaxID=2795726 RepID=A0ABS0XNN4_9SPHN|nr:hypothetical protein [Sphingomonas sp. BT553]MBJ6121643.1 hypothetical protein [Sphingomonas sp. BT553]